MNRLFYALHKWISAIAFVQLAVWTVSGFTFTWIKQEAIRSTPVEGAHRGVIDHGALVSISRALEQSEAVTGPVERVELRGTPSGAYYVVRGREAAVRVDARSGQVAPVKEDEAATIARRDQPGNPPVRDVARIESSPPLEYRDCEPAECSLPVFRIALDDAAGTVVYVDATTGDVTARRNDAWRTYDFFWSLHIMDYRAREDFNHWLIRGAAILAMATVLSGTILLSIRSTRWIRRSVMRWRAR